MPEVKLITSNGSIDFNGRIQHKYKEQVAMAALQITSLDLSQNYYYFFAKFHCS